MASLIISPRFVNLPSGIQLYTEWITSKNASGSDPSTTIVFLHGLGGSTNIFYPIFAGVLSAFPSATLLAYDQPGTCNSLKPPLSHMTCKGMIESLGALLDQEVPKGNIVVVAHSASTFLVSQYLLSFAPAIPRITHVVFIGGPMNTPVPTEQVEFLTRTGDAFEASAGPPSSVIDNVLSAWTGKTAIEKKPVVIALTRALFVVQPKKEFMSLWRDFVRAVATTSLPFERYPRTIKSLIIYGLDDEVIEEGVMEAVTAKIRGAKLVKIPAVGHTPQAEDPETTSAIIADFLKQ